MTTNPIDVLKRERGHHFFAPVRAIKQIPALTATDLVGFSDKTIHLHYFVGSSDWWIAEYDPTTGMAFGFALVGGDVAMSEWGYISLVELASIHTTHRDGQPILPIIVERDLDWHPVPAREVPGIKTRGE